LKLPVRHQLVVAAAIAFSAFGATLAVGPAAQAAPPRPAASAPALVNCLGKATVKPRSFIITCADGNNYLASLKWSHWASTASGKGINWINDCVPACFDGKFYKYPAQVYLWRARPRPRHSGQEYFTRMTLTYTGAVPKGSHRHHTIDLWSN